MAPINCNKSYVPFECINIQEDNSEEQLKKDEIFYQQLFTRIVSPNICCENELESIPANRKRYYEIHSAQPTSKAKRKREGTALTSQSMNGLLDVSTPEILMEEQGLELSATDGLTDSSSTSEVKSTKRFKFFTLEEDQALIKFADKYPKGVSISWRKLVLEGRISTQFRSRWVALSSKALESGNYGKSFTLEEDQALIKFADKYPKGVSIPWRKLELEGRTFKQFSERWVTLSSKALESSKYGKNFISGEDQALKEFVDKYPKGARIRWRELKLEGRTSRQCRQRWYILSSKLLASGTYRKSFTSEEDQALKEFADKYPKGVRIPWSELELEGRTSAQCSQRWRSLSSKLLASGTYRKYFTSAEDQALKEFADKYSKGAKIPWRELKLEGRTSVQCSQRWSSLLSKLLASDTFGKHFIPEEDQALKEFADKYPAGVFIPWRKFELEGRTFAQCRQRWYFLQSI